MHTFPAHAHLQAFFQAAVLALVSVVLVYRADAIPSTRVRQVSPHAPLKKTLAACETRRLCLLEFTKQ